MKQSLRIAIADDEPLMLDFFQDALTRLGHLVVVRASTGQELVDECRKNRPDLVITDIRMPVLDGLDAVEQISLDEPIPVVVVTAYYDPSYVARAEERQILAYLIKPVKDVDLGPAISIAMRRFEEFRALHRETDGLRQALEDRKVIERAKGVLMRQAQLDEEAAFRRLQKLARSSNKKLIEIARMILLAADAMTPCETSR